MANNYTYKNKDYKTLEELADKVGLHSKTIQVRMNNGLSLQEAISKGDVVNYGIKIGNRLYRSLREIYDVHVEHGDVLKGRIELRGMNPKQALLDVLKIETIVYDDKEYRGIAELCTTYGIKQTVVKRRLFNIKGIDLKGAIERPIDTTKIGNPHMFRGKTYATQSDLLKDYNVNIGFIKRVMDSLGGNITHEQALEIILTFFKQYGLPKPTTELTVIPSILYNGTYYTHLIDFYISIGIDGSKFIQFATKHSGLTRKEILILMLNATQEKWVDNETSKVETQSYLLKKYKTTLLTLEKKGFATKQQVRKYPKMVFNPNLQYFEVQEVFDKYLQSIRGTN